MTSKTESLIRDLAALFVKYRLSDWTPLLAELEERGGSAALAAAIQKHAARATPASTTAKRAGAKKPSRKTAVVKPIELELEPRFSGPHAATIEELREAMVAKRSFPAMSDLKAVSSALGIKSARTSRRDLLVTTLTEHLDRLDQEAFERALRILAREEERNESDAMPVYDRWFDLITADRKRSR